MSRYAGVKVFHPKNCCHHFLDQSPIGIIRPTQGSGERVSKSHIAGMRASINTTTTRNDSESTSNRKIAYRRLITFVESGPVEGIAAIAAWALEKSFLSTRSPPRPV